MRLTRTPFLLMALCMTACVGGRLQAYTKADEPLYEVLRELDRNPTNLQAQKELPLLYQQALVRHKAAFYSSSMAYHFEKFDQVAFETEVLQHINAAIRSIPAALAVVKPVEDWSTMNAREDKRQQVDRYWRDLTESALRDTVNCQY